jgi:RNA polymerase sigma factor (TIGR02999 family)
LDSDPRDSRRTDLSVLLEQAGHGDADARALVATEVYGELRMLARQRLAGGSQVSLQPTELVHELYARLFPREDLNWENRRHFFRIAARAMQGIVIDRARASAAEKRGGGQRLEPLSHALDAAVESPEQIVLLGHAMDRLAEEDPLAAEVVRLRYFVGLDGEECAEALGVSASTVDRRWRYARAWLHRAVFGGGDDAA